MKVMVEDVPESWRRPSDPLLREWLAEALQRMDGSELEQVERSGLHWGDNVGAQVLVSSKDIDSLSPEDADVAVVFVVEPSDELRVHDASRDDLDYLHVDLSRADSSIDELAAWLGRYA